MNRLAIFTCILALMVHGYTEDAQTSDYGLPKAPPWEEVAAKNQKHRITDKLDLASREEMEAIINRLPQVFHAAELNLQPGKEKKHVIRVVKDHTYFFFYLLDQSDGFRVIQEDPGLRDEIINTNTEASELYTTYQSTFNGELQIHMLAKQGATCDIMVGIARTTSDTAAAGFRKLGRHRLLSKQLLYGR